MPANKRLSHAFMIAVHKNVEQIEFVCDQLSFGDVFIHVDKKAEDVYQQLKNRYQQAGHIHVLDARVNIIWSGLSQVQATLALMRAVQSTKKNYDYIHLISGQDLLVVSPRDLDHLLINHGLDTEYIEIEPIGSLFWRLRCYSFFCENPRNRTLLYRILDNAIRWPQLICVRRHNFQGYDLYKGASWFSITSAFLDYVLHIVDTTDYMDRFAYTACPDEHFFQVLAMNSAFKAHVFGSNLRYVRFAGWHTSPDVLTAKDSSLFMKGDHIFARKFDDIKEEKQIMDRIGEK